MKTLLHYILPCFVLVCSYALNGQNLQQYEKAANVAMQNKDYFSAANYFEIVEKGGRKKIAFLKQYAKACRLSFNYPKAIELYRLIIEKENQESNALNHYYLAACLKMEAKYDKASKQYTFFLKEAADLYPFEQAKAQQEIKACEIAKSLLAKPKKLKITHLGDSVNGPYSEFAPLYVDNELWFSSLRFPRKHRKKDKTINPTFTSKILKANSKKARVIAGINRGNVFNGNAALSPDDQFLYFTRCTGSNYEDIRCDIYYSVRENKSWSLPKALPTPVNQTNSSQSHPAIVQIEQTLFLYFSSNRDGGFGQTDLWRTKIIQHGTKYGLIENLGEEINTPGKEICPFYTDKRLYFSSDWHPGLGGFDIFYTSKSDTGLAIINHGNGLNSAADDLHFYKDSSNIAMFSSNRPGSKQLKGAICCHDIYSIVLPKMDSIPEPIVQVPTVVTIDTVIPDLVLKTPELPELKDLLPIKLFFHNDEPDSNSVAQTTSKSYKETFNAYYDLKNVYKKNYTTSLQPFEMGKARQKLENFFEAEVNGYAILLDSFTNGVLLHLQAGSSIQLKIRGFTSPRSNSDYNNKLASRRISTIINHFKTWDNEVFLPFIKDGLLRFEELPLGELQSPQNISDAINDPRNSIYSVEASRERRVEIEQIIID